MKQAIGTFSLMVASTFIAAIRKLVTGASYVDADYITTDYVTP